MNSSLVSKKIKTNTPSLIQQKIKILKNEIQILMNKPDCNSDLKSDKMLELQNLTLQLKETRLNNEYNKICRTTDSMQYTRLKNKPNSIELLSDIKDKREKAKEEFEKIKEIEDKYTTLENKLFNETKLHIPGFLFFHKEILDNYGMCPYLDIDIDEQELNSGINMIENRNKWINDQLDQGKLYKTIYDKIINKSNYHQYMKKSLELVSYFENIHDTLFTETQKQIFTNSLSYIEEYTQCPIKTKKIKEKFKIIINNISMLVMETGLNIHTYLYLKMNVEIPINNIKTTSVDKDFINIGIIEYYNKHLEDFTINKENIANSIRYAKNVTNELKYALSEYLYNKSIKSKVETIKYIGQYFKKWSLLLENEKIERLEYFSDYFVQKYLVHSKLIEPLDGPIKIEELSKILVDSYKNKLLKYKYIKWNINTGVIEKIFALKYNDDDKKFFLDIKGTESSNSTTSRSTADTSEENEIHQAQETATVTKKTVSTKTIFNKTNEKIINEEIIVFIIKNNNNNSNDKPDNRELKELFHESIKLKLRLKRINATDKQKIYEKFDEVFNVIKNNSY